MQQQTREQQEAFSCLPVHVTPFSPDFDSSSQRDQLPSALSAKLCQAGGAGIALEGLPLRAAEQAACMSCSDDIPSNCSR